MRRRIIITLFFVITVFSCAFASSTEYARFKYKIRYNVSDYIELNFTNIALTPIENYNLDLDASINDDQVLLCVSTNKTNAYALKLTFFPLYGNSDPNHNFTGCYKVRILNPENSHLETTSQMNSDNTLTVNNSLGNFVIFLGDTVENASNREAFYYPISFDFSDYLDDYPVDDYKGTIKVEVIT